MWLKSSIRFLFAIMFSWFALQKIHSFGVVEGSVFSSLPIWMRICVISVELIMSAWLFSGKNSRAAMIATIIVLSAFSGVITHQLRQPAPLPCGCGSLSQQLEKTLSVRSSLKFGLARNCLLLAASFYYISALPARKTLNLVQRANC